jgi:hypothetical protein
VLVGDSKARCGATVAPTPSFESDFGKFAREHAPTYVPNLEHLKNKLEHHAIFLERTARLAASLRVSIRDVAQHVGISQASLFAYRAGKNPITAKVWRKLEEAEMKAGLLERRSATHAVSGAHLERPATSSDGARSQVVASRSNSDQRYPADRSECEAFFTAYLNAAEDSRDPNAFPYVMRILRRTFDPSEWEREKLKSEQ